MSKCYMAMMMMMNVVVVAVITFCAVESFEAIEASALAINRATSACFIGA